MLIPPRSSPPLRDPFPEPPYPENPSPWPAGPPSPRQGPKHSPKAPNSEQRAGARQEGLPHAGAVGGHGGHGATSILSGTKELPGCPRPPQAGFPACPPLPPPCRGKGVTAGIPCQSATRHPPGIPEAGTGACRPCNDTEILMAICTSDFVIRGSIRSVSNDAELQESIIGVSATRIHRQKFPLFQAGGQLGQPVGSIRTPLRCGVKPGPGTFLFTGWLHFGEAWLSCAPRYRDFQRIYEGARRTRQNPCEFPVD
uniref:Meteorin, glial cell differentiation regulator n=1 Tax=Malurus cyaneus samueli TaxID=2593467 RepID=A0A8C5UAG9_9PASS